MPLYGRLSDLYGRKPVFVASALIFVAGSALCGIAQDMPQLVAFRAIQGIGAGGIIPVTLTIFGDIYSAEERAKMTGIFSAVWGSSALAGPTLGAFIVQYVDWRWVFYINLPFGAVAIAMMWRYLQEERPTARVRIDYLGALTLTLSIIALMLALLQVGEGARWLSLEVLGLMVAALGLLAFFIRLERRAPNPILPLDIFRSRIVTVVSISSVLIGGTMFGVTSYVPLYSQGVLGGSAVDAGLVLLPFSVSWSIASPIAGRIIVRAGYRVSVVAGMMSAVAGSSALLLLSPERGMLPAVIGAALVGAGMGLSTTATLIAVQNSVDRTQRGVVTAMATFSRTIGGAIGVAAMGTMLTTGMASRLSNLDSELQDTNALLDVEIRDTLAPATYDQLRFALDATLQNIYLAALILAVLAAAVVILRFPRGGMAELQSPGAGMGGSTAQPAPVQPADG